MDKKKVGIVTFHTADNYGAVLQAYALQHYIEALDFDVKIIDFRTPNHELEHKLFREKSNSTIKTAAYRFFTLLHYCALRKRIKLFAQFRREYFHLTSHRYDSQDDFLNNMEDFDSYITGSDQVFNPCVENSECYYLDFKKYGRRKIAYAPSFGISSFTDQQKIEIKDRLKTFDALSCREDVGAEFMKSLLGIDVPTVCDPVFLLAREEWENVSMISDKKPYVLVYDLNGGYNLVNYAKDVRKKYGDAEIVCITTKTRVFYNGVKVLRNIGPREFVGLIQNALCVVTDSFHGLSFSLIFNKPLYSLIAFPAASSRIDSLMLKLGVVKRKCTYGDIYEAADTFNNFNAILSKIIFSSKQYLITALKY